MEQTTSDKAVMKALGLNPGNLEHLINVSLEPVSFTPGSSLGWGKEWTAVHSADNDMMLSHQGIGIEVEGRRFSVENKRSTSYNSLLRMWRELLDEDDDR